MFKVLLLFSFFCMGWSSKMNLRGEIQPMSNQTDEWSRFSNFKEVFTKNYDTYDEMILRFKIFSSNVRVMIEHNNDKTQTFTMGINQFTDLTSQEFKNQYVSGLNGNLKSYGCKSFSSSGNNLPSSIDWRTKGAVTSVKNQGQCGSCWTFSATGAVEGAWAISTGKLIDLSEQELVDCAKGVAYGSHGCSGGQMEGAFKYIMENGQCSNSAYPYLSGDTKLDGTCKTCSSVAHVNSCFDVKPNDQISLKGAVAKQPIAIAIEADTKYFQSYSSGILTSTSCGTTLDHGVLIVGYGTENNIDYYLVKNSWGETWGDAGYVKIARTSSTNDAGICGIAMNPSFPMV